MHEFDVQFDAILRGIGRVVPRSALSIFSPTEVETIMCGDQYIDLEMLQRHTVYGHNISRDSPHINMLWSVLEQFNDKLRSLFIQYTWGRSRLPASDLAFGSNLLKIIQHGKAQQVRIMTICMELLSLLQTDAVVLF